MNDRPDALSGLALGPLADDESACRKIQARRKVSNTALRPDTLHCLIPTAHENSRALTKARVSIHASTSASLNRGRGILPRLSSYVAPTDNQKSSGGMNRRGFFFDAIGSSDQSISSTARPAMISSASAIAFGCGCSFIVFSLRGRRPSAAASDRRSANSRTTFRSASRTSSSKGL